MRSRGLVLVVLCGVVWVRLGAAQEVSEQEQIRRMTAHPPGQNGPGAAPGQTKGAPPGPNQGAGGPPPVEEKVQIADAPRALPDCGCAAQPVFSIRSGDAAAGFEVSIASTSNNAAIYYTTDGWTPTEESTRYTGPIHVGESLRLQAIAEEPQKLPSAIAEASYVVTGAAPLAQSVAAPDGVLRQGTELRLVTHTDISSDEAQAGDPVSLELDEDVTAGGAVLAPKGSRAAGVLTRVVRAGPNGKRGEMVFQVQSLTAGEVMVPLEATLTLTAPDPGGRQLIANASLVHVAGALPRGEDVEIMPGMRLTARVKADTVLKR